MSPFDRTLRTVFDRLNEPQRRAVEAIEGPVLVIAGPGTGKTEILAARIANILLTTDARPENILCLTYTDAGTVAMRSRLLECIGPDAYRVDIFTFHAFCNLVIQENADQFGFRSLAPVSELEQFQLVREIIDDFPQEHPLTRSTGDIHFEADRLLALYEIMKKEGWSPDFLVQHADRYIATLLDDPDYRYKRGSRDRDGAVHRKGDLNEKKLRDMTRRLEQLKAAAATFDDYQQRLLGYGRYDFSDMILWCSAAFERSPDLLSRYQERYLYLLVDEFQDTSGSQFELLMQLVDYWDAPNLFVVGDDDQSIYRFQGASIENIRRFQERYRKNGLIEVVLTDNHRSSQSILDAASRLIRNNNERLTDDKQLRAMNPEVALVPDRPRLCCYPTQAQETVGVAREIERLRDSGVPLSRIAVIYRNHMQSDEIIRYLGGRGIPVDTRRRADLLREPLIERLLTLLRYLAAELNRPHSGERLLFELLHEPWFGIPPLSLARLSLEIGRRNCDGRVTSWRDELAALSRPSLQGELFVDPAQEALARAGTLLEELLRDAVCKPLQELLHQVITKLGILSAALTSGERLWHLQLLNTLFDFVREESVKSRLGLAGFLALLQDMTQQRISVPVEKLSYGGEGVHFLTAHAAKGLQFDYVFMLGCTSAAWDVAGRSRTYILPPAIWTRCSGSEEEEARRLFYVAMTRARRQLVISWPTRDNNDKELEQSRFVAELLDGSALVPEKVLLSDEALIAFGGVSLKAQPDLPSELIDAGFVDSLLQKYSLSVTHLNTYLRCPLSFYFNTVLRVPAPMNAAMTFGSAVHYALEQLFRKMLADPARSFPQSDLLVADFHTYLQRHEDSFTPSEYRRRLSYGETILPAFYDRYASSWQRNVLVEYPCRSIVMGEVPLNGKLDKVELTGNRARVIDYKTGTYKNALKKLQPPNLERVAKTLDAGKQSTHEDVRGGDYWRQAVFYRILLEHDSRRRLTMTGAEFVFVEPDKESGAFHTAEVMVTDEDLAIVTAQIKDTYAKIRAKEFGVGCGEADCEWCRFVRRFEGVKTDRPENLEVLRPSVSAASGKVYLMPGY